MNNIKKVLALVGISCCCLSADCMMDWNRNIEELKAKVTDLEQARRPQIHKLEEVRDQIFKYKKDILDEQIADPTLMRDITAIDLRIEELSRNGRLLGARKATKDVPLYDRTDDSTDSIAYSGVANMFTNAEFDALVTDVNSQAEQKQDNSAEVGELRCRAMIIGTAAGASATAVISGICYYYGIDTVREAVMSVATPAWTWIQSFFH